MQSLRRTIRTTPWKHSMSKRVTHESTAQTSNACKRKPDCATARGNNFQLVQRPTASTIFAQQIQRSCPALSLKSFSTLTNVSEPDESLRNGGREWECTVLGLKIKGLEWGDPSSPRKVLCLHGYMDNAMSFSTLVPLLSPRQLHIIAIDLPGHGHSDHFASYAGPYRPEDFVRVVAMLIRDLDPACDLTLLCHSMGAGIGPGVAVVLPERVHRLILLEGMGFVTSPPDAVAQNLKRHCDDVAAAAARPPSAGYPTLDELIRRLRRTHTGALSHADAQRLALRGARFRRGGDWDPTAASQSAAGTAIPAGSGGGDGGGDGGGGWVFTHDRRLRVATALRLSEEQMLRLLGAVKCPALLLVATEGYPWGRGLLDRRAEAFGGALTRAAVQGSHHVHLSNPERVVPHIEAFLDSE